MIARRLERPIDAAEHRAAAVTDFAELAVHQPRCPDDVAAIGLTDRLMAEADAEDRDFWPGAFDERQADAGLLRRARSGRDDDAVGVHGEDVVDADLVVA